MNSRVSRLPAVSTVQRITPASGSLAPSTNLEADTLIRRVEAEHDLLRHEVDGWCAWPVIRLEVSSRLLKRGDDRGGWRRRDLGSLAAAAWRDLLGIPRLRSAEYLFLCYASNRSDERDGRSRDIFFDDLIERLEAGRPPGARPVCLKVEHADNPLFGARARQASIPAAMGTALVTLASHVLSRLWPAPEIERVARRIEGALAEGMGKAPISRKEIARRLKHFRWSRRLYGLVFGRVRPRLLGLVTAYGNHAAIAAAKQRGSRVVEFQHGHNARDHGGYSWTAYARAYRARMPVPDRILVYGDFWAEELRAFGFWEREVISAGSAQMQRYRDLRRPAPPQPPILTLTTQGVDTERILQFFREFLRLMADRPITLFMKLHPAQRDTTPYTDAFAWDARVTVVGAHESPSTFDLISRASLHVSVSSTCHYEAIALGVPTAILPFTGHEMVLDLIRRPAARLVSSPQDLVDCFLAAPSAAVRREDREYYFAADGLAAMQRALTEA